MKQPLLEPDQAPDTTNIATGSPERFGYSWDKASEMSAEYKDLFDGWCSALPTSAWKSARFIDVGCGMGRNSVWACKKGAQGGVAIDVDERSLNATRFNLKKFDVEVSYMSAYEIDYTEQFDIAFSLGVIHHLEFPEKALKQMVQAVRPNGWVLVWLYGRENNGWIVNLFNPIRKLLFSRLPLSIVNILAWVLTAILMLMLRFGWGSLPYHDRLRKMEIKHIKLVVLDHMIPNIANYYTRQEAEELLKQTGLVDVKSVWVNEMSWSVVGRKEN